MSKPPRQKPGRSKQDYATPKDFLAAVERRFGVIRTDLAAGAENAVAPVHFDEQQNSLIQDWDVLKGVAFCNPPFADLAPWAEKCSSVRDRRAWTLLLTPAAVGSEWMADHVLGKALLLFLSPRLCFDGKNAYPKDLTLAAFGFGVVGMGRWRWK
jgi:phage N-6-adenine-methyltransferase